MVTLAHKSLKFISFIVLFFIVTKVSGIYFYNYSLINNDSAIQIAQLITKNPTPEDIYDVFSYVIIIENILISIFFYSLFVHFVPISKIKKIGFKGNILVIGQEIIIRIFKFVMF